MVLEQIIKDIDKPFRHTRQHRNQTERIRYTIIKRQATNIVVLIWINLRLLTQPNEVPTSTF